MIYDECRNLDLQLQIFQLVFGFSILSLDDPFFGGKTYFLSLMGVTHAEVPKRKMETWLLILLVHWFRFGWSNQMPSCRLTTGTRATTAKEYPPHTRKKYLQTSWTVGHDSSCPPFL